MHRSQLQQFNLSLVYGYIYIYIYTLHAKNRHNAPNSMFFLQILEVNSNSFLSISYQKALEILRNGTHLSITVKSNVLGFKEMLSCDNNTEPDCCRQISSKFLSTDSHLLPRTNSYGINFSFCILLSFILHIRNRIGSNAVFEQCKLIQPRANKL